LGKNVRKPQRGGYFLTRTVVAMLSKYTPCLGKKRPQYSRHNFDKFSHGFVIFGKNHPDASMYLTIKNLAQLSGWMLPTVVAHLSSQAPPLCPVSILACSLSQRYWSVYLYAAVCWVNYSACLDVAIFVLANQVFWRLFYHVRLLLLPPCRVRMLTCCWELAWIRRGRSFGE